MFVVPRPDHSSSGLYADYEFNRMFRLQFDEYKDAFVGSLKRKLAMCDKVDGSPALMRRAFLDVGCGGGGYVWAAKELGLRAFGVDVDSVSVSFARASGLNVYCGELKDAPFEPNSFDLIQLKQVLEHVPRPYELMVEVRKLLKPQAIVVIDVPNQRGLLATLRGLNIRRKNEYRSLQPPRHLSAFTKSAMRALLERAGFRARVWAQCGPGDPTYYPLIGRNWRRRALYSLPASLGLGSVLVVYAQKGDGCAQ